MSLKFYNGKTHSIEDVWRSLDRSEKFGWSWCNDTHQPLRHMAIVLYFDGIPIYTINFRTGDGASKLAAAVNEVKPLITIEDAPRNGYDFHSTLEEFEVKTRCEKKRAKDRILDIIRFNPGHYNLFTNNCRDHVTGVLKALLGKKLSDTEFNNSMVQTRNEDTIWIVGVAGTAIFLLVRLLATAIFRANLKK